MAAIWQTFSSFYVNPEECFVTWDPRFETVSDVYDDQFVDIEQEAARYRPPEEVAKVIDDLIDKTIHRQLVSDRFDESFFLRRGFSVLTTEGTHILKHRDLPGYLIKVSRNEERPYFLDGDYDQTKVRTIKHMNLLRAPGRQYYYEHMNASDDRFYHLPDEYLYKSPHARRSDPLHHRFYAISAMSDAYSPQESIQQINQMDEEGQRQIAKNKIAFIERTGLVDVHTGNFLLRKDGQGFDVIDLEPLGVMVEKEDTSNNLLTHEQQVALGLLYFRNVYCLQEAQNSVMAEEAGLALEDYLEAHPDLHMHKISILTCGQWCELIVKIFFSVIIPLIPLLVFIWACASVWCCSDQSSNEEGFNQHEPLYA